MSENLFTIKPNSTLILPDGLKRQYTISGDLHGDIEWDEVRGRLIYKPEYNFTGTVEFIYQDFYDETISIPFKIEVANTFKPRARIIKIIGQELISSDVIALVELIKNAYDADATTIDLTLNNIFSSQGEILVKDSGIGMSYEKIINVWLEPATPDKKLGNEKRYSQKYHRRFLGEKGIGRFAVHRLGERIQLISRSYETNGGLLEYETIVDIDWSDFTEDKYLDEIPVKISKVTPPKVFSEGTGTEIRILNINPWQSRKSITDAIIKIRGLESPVKPKNTKHHKLVEHNDPGLTIAVTSNDDKLNKEIKDIKSLGDLLNTAFYTFSAIVDEKGTILYDYTFNRPDYQDIKRLNESTKEADLTEADADWYNEHPLTFQNTPGTFEISLYAWDLEPSALKVAGLADYYKNIIRPNAGIRIYRDNFRVWPYGEPDDDWLELDLTRLNAPKERSVSRNQVFGIIHISSVDNSSLQDQSNREGLIENEQYDQFYKLVSSAVSLFARERKADKIKIDKVTKSKNLSDLVTLGLTTLKSKVETNNHSSLYLDDLTKIESDYKEKIDDILERYMMAAAIGISYSIPIHEMKLRLSSIKHVLEDLEKKPSLQDQYLRQLFEYLKDTEDIMRAATSMMSRQKSQKVNLFKVANNVKILKERDLEKFNISIEIRGDKSLEVEAVPGLLNTAVLNIVDNSIYWLRVKKNRERENNRSFTPSILLEVVRNDDGRIQLSIKDNGDGFSDPFDLLIEPYYSRKVDGLGIGLYLVNEIMIRFGGRLNGYNDSGATIELIF